MVELTGLRSKKPAEVTIIDLSGKELKTWYGRGPIECDIRHYKSGNYVLKIEAGQQRYTQQTTVR